jgi:hypothetical protein
MVNCHFAANKNSLKNIATHVTEINWHLNQIINNHLAMSKFDGSKMLRVYLGSIQTEIDEEILIQFFNTFFPHIRKCRTCGG